MTSRAAVEKLQHHHRRLLGGDTAHLPANPPVVPGVDPALEQIPRNTLQDHEVLHQPGRPRARRRRPVTRTGSGPHPGRPLAHAGTGTKRSRMLAALAFTPMAAGLPRLRAATGATRQAAAGRRA